MIIKWNELFESNRKCTLYGSAYIGARLPLFYPVYLLMSDKVIIPCIRYISDENGFVIMSGVCGLGEKERKSHSVAMGIILRTKTISQTVCVCKWVSVCVCETEAVSILFAYSDVMSHFFSCHLRESIFFSIPLSFFLLRFSVYCVSVFFLVSCCYCSLIAINQSAYMWESCTI